MHELKENFRQQDDPELQLCLDELHDGDRMAGHGTSCSGEALVCKITTTLSSKTKTTQSPLPPLRHAFLPKSGQTPPLATPCLDATRSTTTRASRPRIVGWYTRRPSSHPTGENSNRQEVGCAQCWNIPTTRVSSCPGCGV